MREVEATAVVLSLRDAWPFRYGCERMQVNTEPPSQPRDAVNIWHCR